MTISLKTAPLLEVSNLSVDFRTDGGWINAVDDVNFTLAPRETLGLVGESGSGEKRDRSIPAAPSRPAQQPAGRLCPATRAKTCSRLRPAAFGKSADMRSPWCFGTRSIH